jgi:hypothetical protein
MACFIHLFVKLKKITLLCILAGTSHRYQLIRSGQQLSLIRMQRPFQVVVEGGVVVGEGAEEEVYLLVIVISVW